MEMPTYVDPNACNACQDEHQGPLCVYICPNDLMVLDESTNKGFNQEPEMCSECYACVKLCPQEALHVRGYADFVPMGASVHLPVAYQARGLGGPMGRIHRRPAYRTQEPVFGRRLLMVGRRYFTHSQIANLTGIID